MNINSLEYKNESSSFIEMEMKSDPLTKSMALGFVAPRGIINYGKDGIYIYKIR